MQKAAETTMRYKKLRDLLLSIADCYCFVAGIYALPEKCSGYIILWTWQCARMLTLLTLGLSMRASCLVMVPILTVVDRRVHSDAAV